MITIKDLLTPVPARSDFLKPSNLQIILQNRFKKLEGRNPKQCFTTLARNINNRLNKSNKHIGNFLSNRANVVWMEQCIGERGSVFDIDCVEESLSVHVSVPVVSSTVMVSTAPISSMSTSTVTTTTTMSSTPRISVPIISLNDTPSTRIN